MPKSVTRKKRARGIRIRKEGGENPCK